MKRCLMACVVVCGWCSLLMAQDGKADAQSLIGHWKLSSDARDSGPHGLHGQNHGVKFGAVPADSQQTVGLFGGRDQSITVPSAEALRLGTKDFSIALWVHTAENLDDDLGDLLSLYSTQTRTGFNLSLRNNSGTTSSLANSRQLQFGIDQGSAPEFTDMGRPGNAILGFSMCVYQGELYVGTCEAGTQQSGHVYRYAGGTNWVDCGALDGSNAVSSLVVYQGKLYAGTAKYRLGGSALTESENPKLGGSVFRYEGDQKWTACGRMPQTEGIGGMTVYKGRLYASSLYKPAGFFRFEEGEKWTTLPSPNGKRTEALGVYNGYLWACGYDEGHVYRFDGETWFDTGAVGENTQTYSFAIYQGKLCVATWPSGKVFRLDGENHWEDLGRLGMELEVMGMIVHNGKLYGGTLPLAQVYRFDDDRQWNLLSQLDKTPDVKYRRVWTVAQYGGKAIWSTLPTGHIHAMSAGQSIDYGREIAPGWRHIGVVKEKGRLRLFVDGARVAESAEFDPAKFNLTTDQPLKIGAGSGDSFNGAIKDVRVYGRALNDAEMGLQAAEGK